MVRRNQRRTTRLPTTLTAKVSAISRTSTERLWRRRSRDAGPGGESPVVILMGPAEALYVLGGERPGADDAHVAAGDVDELWQFIQARLAQPTPYSRDLLLAHGPEFEYSERPPLMAHTSLQEKRRSAVFEPRCQRDTGCQRRKYHARRTRRHHIHGKQSGARFGPASGRIRADCGSRKGWEMRHRAGESVPVTAGR
jgi:hypothetical protein